MAQRMEQSKRGMKAAIVVTAGLIATLFVVLVIPEWLTVQGADPAKTMVFESKLGNVTFDHEKHQARVKGDCTACHEKLFPQSRAPINYKAGMHKPAETKKVSCAGCHHAGGPSFESKGNCNTCHQKG